MSEHRAVPSEVDQATREIAASVAAKGVPIDIPAMDTVTFLEEIERWKMEVDIARRQFDSIIDPLLIDHVVFRIGAAEKRLNYLYQLARKMRLEVDQAEWQCTI